MSILEEGNVGIEGRYKKKKVNKKTKEDLHLLTSWNKILRLWVKQTEKWGHCGKKKQVIERGQKIDFSREEKNGFLAYVYFKSSFYLLCTWESFQVSREAAWMHLPGNRWAELGICLRMSLHIMFPTCSFSLSKSAVMRVQNKHISVCLWLN